MDNSQLSMVAQTQMGYHMVILNLFHCLHCKGVLPFGEAIRSLEDMDQKLTTGVPPATRTVLQGMIAGLKDLSGGAPPPNPAAPPPPMRPSLQVIQGGRNT